MKKNGFSLMVMIILCFMVSPVYGKVEGFKETHRKIDEKDTWHTYTHEKSGLEVIWIENKDIHKAFALGVKTPTTNDTGVNHIIEHTIFTGSKKFPSSSVFFDASEAYPNTYMNALTSGDMTIFPFSTPYISCFNALRDIYLDAIFNPNLLREPYGFYEEAFHSVPEEKRCGGVVYNEMKGAYGSIERAVYRGIRETIYKDSHYAFDSGGAPNVIPSLQYEEFVQTYKRYYYPGNMKIIVYGDIPIEETLSCLVPYIKDYPKKESIDLSVDSLHIQNSYQYGNLPTEDTGCVVKTFVLDKCITSKELQELDLWMSAYLMSSKAYFQNQLQRLGIHAKWLRDTDVPYPIYAIVVGDVPVDKMEKYSKVLDALFEEMTKHLAKNVFLEQDIIKEAKWLTEKQESNNNRGVYIAQSILEGWAHGRQQEQYYILKSEMMNMKNLNSSISEWLLTKSKKSTIYLLPDKEVLKDPRLLSGKSDEEWNNIYSRMQKWQVQKSPLTPIELNELMIGVSNKPTITKRENYWEMETRVDTQLARSNLYMNTSHIKQECLPYLYLYSFFLEESAKDITPYFGVVTTQCTAYPIKNGYWPCFKVSIITDLDEKQHGILFNEARNYLLNRPNEWYQQKLIELIVDMKGASQNNALGTLAQLTLGQIDERGAYLYQQTYPLYCFCKDILKNQSPHWIQCVKQIDEELYHADGMILATTIPQKGQNAYAKSWEKTLKHFEKGVNLKGSYRFEIPKGNYMVCQDGEVDYCYMSLVKPEGIEGSDYLLAAYLTKHYFNPQLRVKMGAYGAGCQICDFQTIGIYTYRDPNYQNSIGIIQDSPKCLEGGIDENELNYSKAEALSRVHNQYRLLGTPFEQSAILEQLILWGKSPKEIVKLQKDIILSTCREICEKQNDYERIIRKGKVAVMTHKKNVQQQNVTIFRY